MDNVNFNVYVKLIKNIELVKIKYFKYLNNFPSSLIILLIHKYK